MQDFLYFDGDWIRGYSFTTAPGDSDAFHVHLRSPAGLATAAIVFALWLTLASGSHGHAAPLPPLPVINTCGAIDTFLWSPETQVPGRPGFSGSLGHQRVFPARFEIVLKNFSGVDASLAQRINGIMSYRPATTTPRLKLIIASGDRHKFDHARRLCVSGYRVRGDEGGTWTSYRRLVLSPGR